MSDTFSIPLESNPDVLNKYIYELGVSQDWQIIDVFGLDRESLNFIAQPKAVVLLFPCGDKYDEHKKQENEELQKNPDTFAEDLFYTRQYSRNACGTVALIHAILNNKDIELKDNSVLKNYFDKAKNMTPEDRGKLLDSDKKFAICHETIAQEGQTTAPGKDDKVFYHFVAIVGTSDGELVELDGAKHVPVKHGKTTPSEFIFDAAKVCQKFMARDPKEMRFTVLALASSK